MSNKSKGTVKEAAAVTLSSFFNVKERIDISSQAHAARAIASDTDVVELLSDSAVYYRFDTIDADDVLTITSVADNGGVAVFTSVAHGLSNGNVIVIRGCSDETYNVMGTVANKAADTFEIGIAYTATDTGECGVITDTISANNDIILPGGTVIQRSIPEGEQADRNDILVVHFKQETSAVTSYIRFIEL